MKTQQQNETTERRGDGSDSTDLVIRISRYLDQLAPHIKQREAAQLLLEAREYMSVLGDDNLSGMLCGACGSFTADSNMMQVNKTLSQLTVEGARLRVLCDAAARELEQHWDAHSDTEGYGPINLLDALKGKRKPHAFPKRSCFVDHQELPNTCACDTGEIDNCTFSRMGVKRDNCEHWQPERAIKLMADVLGV